MKFEGNAFSLMGLLMRLRIYGFTFMAEAHFDNG